MAAQQKVLYLHNGESHPMSGDPDLLASAKDPLPHMLKTGWRVVSISVATAQPSPSAAPVVLGYAVLEKP